MALRDQHQLSGFGESEFSSGSPSQAAACSRLCDGTHKSGFDGISHSQSQEGTLDISRPSLLREERTIEHYLAEENLALSSYSVKSCFIFFNR